MLRPADFQPKNPRHRLQSSTRQTPPLLQGFCAIVLLTLRHPPVSVVAEMLTALPRKDTRTTKRYAYPQS